MKTASIIIIGNEILSGRTKDTNSNYLAKILVKTLLSNLLADFAPIGAAYEEIGAIKSNPIIFT